MIASCLRPPPAHSSPWGYCTDHIRPRKADVEWRLGLMLTFRGLGGERGQATHIASDGAPHRREPLLLLMYAAY